MAHFAKINSDNIVENVLVVPHEQEHRGQEYLNELGLDGRWIQTSFNNNIRKKFAGIGDEYWEEKDAFRKAQPFPSWIWNNESWSWESPVPMPEDGNEYRWNEGDQSWILKPFPSWIWNNESSTWQAPVAMPEDGNEYRWDEDSSSWVLVESTNG